MITEIIWIHWRIRSITFFSKTKRRIVIWCNPHHHHHHSIAIEQEIDVISFSLNFLIMIHYYYLYKQNTPTIFINNNNHMLSTVTQIERWSTDVSIEHTKNYNLHRRLKITQLMSHWNVIEDINRRHGEIISLYIYTCISKSVSWSSASESSLLTSNSQFMIFSFSFRSFSHISPFPVINIRYKNSTHS